MSLDAGHGAGGIFERVVGLKVGETDGDGIGGVWRRGFGESEQGSDHEGDLLFLRRSLADDRLFDAAGGIFVDFQVMFGGGEQGGAPGGAHDDGSFVALDKNDALDGAHMGLMIADHAVQFLANGHQTLGLAPGGRVVDDTPRERLGLATQSFQNGIASVA